MPDFKRNNRFSGHGARKPYDRGGGSRAPYRGAPSDREMFDTTCANCGTMTKVPFRPNGTKPVYCRDCFKPENDRAPQRFEKREFGPARSFAPQRESGPGMGEVKRELERMNATLDKIASMLEKTGRDAALTKELAPYHAPAAKDKKPAKKGKAKKA